MNKKNKILFFVSITVISLYFVIKNTESEESLKNTPQATISLYNNEECKGLEKNIKTMVDNANYCIYDSDCTPKISVGYPASCSTLVNKNSDIPDIESVYVQFVSKCNPPIYDCDRTPVQEEIKCIDRVCIDTRFEN